MDSFKYLDLTERDTHLISLHIRLMTVMPGKMVRLEQIRANLNLPRYSDAQIFSCIALLVDEGWCDLSCSVRHSNQLKNGYICRRA